MAQRPTQEDKFKNITLRLDPVALSTSHIVRNSDYRELPRPSTPVNSSSYITQDPRRLNIEIRTSHGTSSPTGLSAKSQLWQHHEQQEKIQGEVALKRELQEKEQIISELKNIIKLSNQNNSRIRPKSLYQSEKSPERDRQLEQDQRELKQLRHNVKVLTIENNALSGYIDKLKAESLSKVELSGSSAIPFRKGDHFQRENNTLTTITELREENKRLNSLLTEKQIANQKKIDEYISTYKSLAQECKRLEQAKEILDNDNERLMLQLRQLEQAQRSRQTGRQSSEKLSLVRIKEQYSQSLKQVRNTIHIQFQNLFDNFRHSLIEIDKKVIFLQRRLQKIEDEIRQKQIQLRFSREVAKKSEIYIQQGSESFASQGSVRKQNFRSAAASRLLDDALRNNDEDVVRPLQEQIIKLKQIIADLENQMSERSDYYTFRQRYQSSEAEISQYRKRVAQKQSDMMREINSLKEQIDHLDSAYQEQKQKTIAIHEAAQKKSQKKLNEISEALNQVQFKYEKSLEEMKNLVNIKRAQADLIDEVENLRQQRTQLLLKVDQYKKLCKLLQEQTQQNTVNYQIFDQMKKQIQEIKLKYHNDIASFTAIQKQNQQIHTANEELKSRLQQARANIKNLQKQSQNFREQLRKITAEKQELIHRAQYNESIVKILEEELKAKKQMEAALIEEKNSLERQLVSYLSIFNKLTFQGGNASNRYEGEQLALQELLSKLSQLEASFNDMHSSRREKREILSKLINDELGEEELSSIKRRYRS